MRGPGRDRIAPGFGTGGHETGGHETGERVDGRMKALRSFFLAGMIVCLGGCGTVIRGFSQDVAFLTEPPGAAVALSDGRSCVPPCTLAVERTAGVTARVSKPGCLDALREIPSRFPEGGTALLGLADYQTGAAAEHRPNPLTVVLICDSGGPIAFSPYDGPTLDLLNGGQDLDVALTPFDEQAFVRQHDRLFPGPARPTP